MHTPLQLAVIQQSRQLRQVYFCQLLKVRMNPVSNWQDCSIIGLGIIAKLCANSQRQFTAERESLRGRAKRCEVESLG